jgi:hypothetical protein
MPFDPDKPYNDLPLLPPKAELETKAVLKKAIAANKALAELKGAGELIPNQSVLIHAIGLREAKLSRNPGFRKITYVCQTNTSPRYVEKNGFFEHMPDHRKPVDMLFGRIWIFFWRDSIYCGRKGCFCGAI